MNILFVNSTVKWGGVKTWMLEYGAKLASRGHKVIICANKKETGSFIERCRENGLTVYPMKFGVDYSPLTIWHFVNLIRKEKIGVVCTNIEKDNRSAGIAAKICGKKVIQRVGLVSDLRNNFKFRVMQAAVVDKIIVPCNYIKEGLKKLSWLKQGKIFVVHNGKDLRKYHPKKWYIEVRRELGIAENAVLLCVSSQLTKTKGHVYLLEAFSLLKERSGDIKLIIIGQGPLREELEGKAKALGLN
ncbi:MAG: glycosyltransferase, partial [Deltaproteobacteria bacterium]